MNYNQALIRARHEAAMEAGPPEAEPPKCPHCGEQLTEILGGFECEVNGCRTCEAGCDEQAMQGSTLCADCAA